jgi:hypothetical protein
VPSELEGRMMNKDDDDWKVYAPTMAYWKKWKEISLERGKRHRENMLKRREITDINVSYSDWDDDGSQFGEWEDEGGISEESRREKQFLSRR